MAILPVYTCENERRSVFPAKCFPEDWLLSAKDLNSIKNPSYDHAYILPNNSVWVVSYDGMRWIMIGIEDGEGTPTMIDNTDGYLDITGNGTQNVVVNLNQEQMEALIQNNLTDLKRQVNEKKDDLYASCYSSTVAEERWYRLARFETSDLTNNYMVSFALIRNCGGSAMYVADCSINIRLIEGIFRLADSNFLVTSRGNVSDIDLADYIMLCFDEEAREISIYAKTEAIYDGWRLNFYATPSTRTGRNAAAAVYQYHDGNGAEAEPTGVKMYPAMVDHIVSVASEDGSVVVTGSGTYDVDLSVNPDIFPKHGNVNWIPDSTGNLRTHSLDYIVSDGYRGNNAFELSRSGYAGTDRISIGLVNFTLPDYTEGSEYTLSAWIYIYDDITLDADNNQVFIRIWDGNNVLKNFPINIPQSTATGKWFKGSALMTLPADVTADNKISLTFAIGKNGHFKISCCMLNSGNVTSDWEPNPADVDKALAEKKDDLWASCYSDTETAEKWFKLAESTEFSGSSDMHLTFVVARNRTGNNEAARYKGIAVVALRYVNGVYNANDSSFRIIASTDDTVDLSSRVFVLIESNKMYLYAKSETTYDGWRIDFLKNPTSRQGIDITHYFTFYNYYNATLALATEPSGTKLLPTRSNAPVNNLTTTTTGSALDAVQGKVLNDRITAQKAGLYASCYAANTTAANIYFKLAEFKFSGQYQNEIISFEILRFKDNQVYDSIATYKANAIINTRSIATADATSGRFLISSATNPAFDIGSYVFCVLREGGTVELWVRNNQSFLGWRINILSVTGRNGANSSENGIILYPDQLDDQAITTEPAGTRLEPIVTGKITSTDGSVIVTPVDSINSSWNLSLPGTRAYAYNDTAEARYYKLAELNITSEQQSRHVSFEMFKTASNPNGNTFNNYKLSGIIGIRYNSPTSISVNFKVTPTSYAYDISDRVFGILTSDYSAVELWVKLDVAYTSWILNVIYATYLSGGNGFQSLTLYPNQTAYQTAAPTGAQKLIPIMTNNIISSDGSAGITHTGQYFDISIPNNHTHSNKTVLDGITSAKVTNWDNGGMNSHSHSNKTVLDAITAAERTNWNDANSKKHEHTNKTVIDVITSTKVSNWDSAAIPFTNLTAKTNPADTDVFAIEDTGRKKLTLLTLYNWIKSKLNLPIVQTGIVSIVSGANSTPGSLEVTFPNPFPGVPRVVVTPKTSVPGTYVLGVGALSETATGFTLWATRINTSAFGVTWIAIYTPE